MSDIRDYFEYNIKKHGEKTDHPQIKIHVKKIGNRIRIKIEYYLKRLTPEMMKLLRSTKSKITKDENGENMPCLEITEVIFVHCNIVKINIQLDWQNIFTEMVKAKVSVTKY